MSALAPALQAYFTQRLVAQRAASPNTIAAYRTTFRLLLRFAAGRTGKTPSKLDIGDLDAPLIGAFLDHLEHHRHNRTTTRNNRLAAIHSLFGYLALQHPEHAASVQRVLAVPSKRTGRNLVTYLTETEVDALLDACDKNTWTGRRDHAMLALTTQTGLRISELARPPAQPRRDRAASCPPPARRSGRLPLPHDQASHHAHPAAHRRDATIPRGQRHRCHRAVAGARATRNDKHLSTRGHESQTTGNRPSQAHRRQAGPLPTRGPAPRLPGEPITMPTYPNR